MIKKYKNIIFSVLLAFFYFLYSEIKLVIRYLKYLYIFFRKIIFFKYLFLKEKNFLILKDSFKKNILKINHEFNKKLVGKNNYKNGKILVTNLLEGKDHSIYNNIIGLNLSKILKKKPVALINKYDFENEIFMRSYGIDKFYYLDNGNFFLRLKYFIQSIGLIGTITETDELLKIRHDKIYIGKIVYDHYVRFSRIASVEKINPKFYFFLSKALLIHNFAKKLFKENSFNEMVQTESQFIPSCPLFQNALLNNCKVYTKIGVGNKFSVRIYDNFEDCYSNRHRFAKKLFNEVFDKHRKIAVQKGEEIIKNRFLGISGYSVDHDVEEGVIPIFREDDVGHYNANYFTKKEICEKFNWDEKKPIIMIFSVNLTDGIFTNSWRLYKDYLTWLRSTLNIIKDFQHINWLVKPHPDDEKYRVITNTKKEVKKISTKNKNVALFPKDSGMNHYLPKIISAAITSSGSIGYEFPSLGIPTIICGESLYSGRGFNYEPQSKQEYVEMLKNGDKLIFLNNEQKDKAKVFAYIYSVLAKIYSPLIPSNSGLRKKDEKKWWKELEMLIENYSDNKDSFKKNFEIQLIKQDRHTINYDYL